jgi:hypothetical protein
MVVRFGSAELLISGSAPTVLTDSGVFTVAIGNTTWVLHDVSYNSPDPENFGVVDTVVQKILK